MAVKQEPIDIADDHDFLHERNDNDDSSLSSMTSCPVDLTLTSQPTSFLDHIRPSMVVDPLHDDVLFLAPTRRGRGRGHTLQGQVQSRREITEYETYSISHHEAELNSKQLPKKYRCRFCVYKTSYKSDLNRHLRKHGIAPQHCPLCNMPFKTAGNLENHIRMAHSICSSSPTLSGMGHLAMSSPTSPVLGGIGGFVSPTTSSPGSGIGFGPPVVLDALGGVAFPGSMGPSELNMMSAAVGEKEGRGSRHRETHHMQDYPVLSQAVLSAQLSCHVCPFVCNDSTVLARHILAHPAEEEAAAASKSSSASSEVPITRLSCSSCGTFVDSFEDLQAHRRTCIGGSDEERQECQKRTSLGTYVQHTTLYCSTCGVLSGSLEELQIHRRSCSKSSYSGKLTPNRSSSVEIHRTVESLKDKVIGMDQSKKISGNVSLRNPRHSLTDDTEGNAGNDSRRLSGDLEHGEKRLGGLARQETMDKLRKSLTVQKDGEQSSTTTLVPERSRDSVDLSLAGSHKTEKDRLETLDMALARSLAVQSLFYSSNHKRHEAQNQNKTNSYSDISFSKTDLAVQNRPGDPNAGIHKRQENNSEKDIAVNLSRDSLVETSATENESAKVKVTEKEDKTSLSRSVRGSALCIEIGSHIDKSSKGKKSSPADHCDSNSGGTKSFIAPEPASFITHNSESIGHMPDGEDFFIKEEPDCQSPAVSIEQDEQREKTMEGYPNIEGNPVSEVSASIPSTGHQGHEGIGHRLTLCAVCDRSFSRKSFVIRHMHEAHGLPLQTDTPLVRQGHSSNTVQSFEQRGSARCSTSPRVTSSCARSSREAARPQGVFRATEPSTSSVLVHDGDLYHVYRPSANYQANDFYSRNQGRQESPSSNFYRQTSQSSSLHVPQHPRVTQQPPVSRRYAKLVSNFDDFAARPYACSLCFFRTSSLGELRLHVHNHLTGGSNTEHIPATARLALHIQRSSPVRLDVQSEVEPQVLQPSNEALFLPVNTALLPTHNPAVQSPGPGTQTRHPRNASSVTDDCFLSVDKPREEEACAKSSNIDDCSEMDVDNEDLIPPESRQTTNNAEQSSHNIRAASPQCGEVPGEADIGETCPASPGTKAKRCEASTRESSVDCTSNSACKDEDSTNTKEFIASEQVSDKPSQQYTSVHTSRESDVKLHGHVPAEELAGSRSPAASVCQRSPGESAERRSTPAAESQNSMEAREFPTPVAVAAMDGASCMETVHKIDNDPMSSEEIDVIQEDNSPSGIVKCQKTCDLQPEDLQNKFEFSTDMLSFLQSPASTVQENQREKEDRQEQPEVQIDSEKDTFISDSSAQCLSVGLHAISSFKHVMEQSGTGCVLGQKESLENGESTDDLSIECASAVTSEKSENKLPGCDDVAYVYGESEGRTLVKEHQDYPAESSGSGLLATGRNSRAIRAKGKNASTSNPEQNLDREKVSRKSDKSARNLHDRKGQKTQLAAFHHNATRAKRARKNTLLPLKTTPLVRSQVVTDLFRISNTSTVPLRAGKNRPRNVYLQRAKRFRTGENKQESSRCDRCGKGFSLKGLCNRHMKFCGLEK